MDEDMDEQEEGREMSIGITGKRIYLSGPMTGIEDYNRAAFDRAASDLIGAGAVQVYNPAVYINDYSARMYGHEECMRPAFWELAHKPWDLTYDLLISLPEWQDSAGARLEREVATAIGMEVHDLGEVL